MVLHETDEVLATRWLRDRDQIAAMILRDRHLEAAFSVASRIVVNKSDLDDVVQIAFAEAFYHLACWNPLRPFRAWLSGIIRYKCVNCLRERKSAKEHHRALLYLRKPFVLPEPYPDEACEYHSPYWFNPSVRNFIVGYLGRMGSERIGFIINPPEERLPGKIKARQTRDRHKIAVPLRIQVEGPELSRRITNELLLATYCGKLPGGLIQ